LCKEFASMAEPFVKWIMEQKDKITKSKSELEDQLKYVEERTTNLTADGAKLKNISELNQKIDAAGITNNRHTTLTSKDVEVLWEQYSSFLGKKMKMLEAEIARARLRGITNEQLKEIETQFQQFDSDKSGAIDRIELKNCLYSLGEEKSRGEVDTIMKKYGGADAKAIKFDGFKEFMIDTLGVTDTKEDIIKSFLLINKGIDVAKDDLMDLVMDAQDFIGFKAQAKKLPAGYDYKTWTEEVYAR